MLSFIENSMMPYALIAWLATDVLLLKFGKNQVALSSYAAALWMIPSILGQASFSFGFGGFQIDVPIGPIPWSWKFIATALTTGFMAKNDFMSSE